MSFASYWQTRRPPPSALTLFHRLHTMEHSRMRRAARSIDEPTSLLRPTTQALEAAAPHLRSACSRGSAAGQRLCHRPDADEAAAGTVSQGPEAQLPRTN